MLGVTPDTGGRGAGEGGQNPTGAMEVANRKGISPRPVEPPPRRAACAERCPHGSGSDGWKRAIFMKPPEGISGGSEELMVPRWPSTSCSRPILNASLGDIFRELQSRSPGRYQPLQFRTQMPRHAENKSSLASNSRGAMARGSNPRAIPNFSLR
jgi:hypothetical protein